MHTRVKPAYAVNLKPALTRCRAVESQVEFEHIDARLAEETDEAVARVFGDKLADPIFRQVAGLGNPRDLKQGPFRRDMWVKPAAGRGHEIGRNLSRRIFQFQLFNVALDALDQRLAGRSEIRASRICRVVGRRNSLCGVVRVRGGRRRWPAMEIRFARELLTEQG